MWETGEQEDSTANRLMSNGAAGRALSRRILSRFELMEPLAADSRKRGHFRLAVSRACLDLLGMLKVLPRDRGEER